MKVRGSALIALLLAACSDSEPLTLELHDNTAQLQRVHTTQYSNIRESRRMLIRDAETWAAVWAEMMSSADPKSAPYVDFTQEDVLVAALGERRVGGYSIMIESLDFNRSGVRITVTSSVPAPSCDRAEVVIAPIDAVRVRKLAVDPTFEERTSIRECT